MMILENHINMPKPVDLTEQSQFPGEYDEQCFGESRQNSSKNLLKKLLIEIAARDKVAHAQANHSTNTARTLPIKSVK
jgi:hypothetical protein